MNVLEKKTLIVGNGGHRHNLVGKIAVKNTKDDIHTLNGNANVNDVVEDFVEIDVLKDTELKHQTADEKFGEHNTLKLDKGLWITGKQVEFNPFDGKVSRVWD
jgi:hypothetical protein